MVESNPYDLRSMASQPVNQLLPVTEGVYGIQGPARIRTWNICMARQRPPGAQNQMCTHLHNPRTRQNRNRLIPSSYTTWVQIRKQSTIARPLLIDLRLGLMIYYFHSPLTICTCKQTLPTPSSVCVVGQILPCACFTQGKALTFFVGKVSLGSSTVRPSTVPEGSSADE